MRILIFSTAYFPHLGGAEIAVKEITDLIGDVAFDMVTVKLDRQDKAQEKIGKVNVYRLGFGLGRIDKLLFPFRAARFASLLHKQNHYAIAWSIMASFSGFSALFFKKKHPEVKFLLTLQEGDDLRLPVRKSFAVSFWFRQIFTKADYIQCISTYLARWARQMGATCPVEVIPNGVAVGKYQISNIKYQTNFKTQTSNTKIILTTSRLVKKNGIEDLIEAVNLLITRYSLPVTLVICGSGAESKKLKVKSEKLGLTDNIKFVGFVQPENLPQYYAMADVFCRPSLSEGLGISFLEAMAYSVPVVATPVGGIPDFLKDGETGWFCNVKDPQSIAEKIAYIFDEKNNIEVIHVTSNAKKLITEKYSWETITHQMRHIFTTLI